MRVPPKLNYYNNLISFDYLKSGGKFPPYKAGGNLISASHYRQTIRIIYPFLIFDFSIMEFILFNKSYIIRSRIFWFTMHGQKLLKTTL